MFQSELPVLKNLKMISIQCITVEFVPVGKLLVSALRQKLITFFVGSLAKLNNKFEKSKHKRDNL